MPLLVLDTNIVLDLLVFADASTQALRQALDHGASWLATVAMREELVRVLTYPQIEKRMWASGINGQGVLGQFDNAVTLVDEACKAPYTCKDRDDQKFIDLALAHRAVLLSKDAAVLSMAARMARLGVTISRGWTP